MLEDLSQFFNEDDFAVEAIITLSNNSQKTVNVIFSAQTMDVAVYDTEIVADTPNFLAASADIAELKDGSPVTIGGKNYKVKKVTDDGTGLSTVYLKK